MVKRVVVWDSGAGENYVRDGPRIANTPYDAVKGTADPFALYEYMRRNFRPKERFSLKLVEVDE